MADDGAISGGGVRQAHAPGRVNLIGDHTDYCGGLALPIAIDRGVDVRLEPTDGDVLTVSSSDQAGSFNLDAGGHAIGSIAPHWSAYVAGTVTAEPPLAVPGGHLAITSDLPAGAGLSSSAALCVGVGLVLHADPDPLAMARRAQAAEANAGIHVGLLDPLVIAGARQGHALLIDFTTLERRHVPLPRGLELTVVHSGVTRRLDTSPYRERRSECASAARVIGPLHAAGVDDLGALADPVLHRRARHVVTECARTAAAAEALAVGDLRSVGMLVSASHRSLAEDFGASVPAVDDLVALLVRRPGVFGARMTGGGFGGCVVALGEPGAIDPGEWPSRAWRVQASDGARASNAGNAGEP